MKKLIWVFIWLCFSFTPNVEMVLLPAPTTTLRLISPVYNSLSVTGSFGELRTNHFHAGIDIRAGQGPKGDHIVAAAQGYVSKIIIDSEDLGKSLYITHPNGLVSVYGHLDDFRQDLKEYLRSKQYLEKTYSIELDFKPDQYPVEAGDFVAYMGNTGSSRGKHIHFEIRNSNGDEVWDPLMFGLPVKDSKPPIIRRIKLYGFDDKGVEQSTKILNKSSLLKSNGVVTVSGDVFSIGVDALDQTDASWNWVGIKSIQLYTDGELQYHFSADKWRREDTKYINAHIDYHAKASAKGNFHRCFLLSGNRINLYNTHENDGLVFLEDEKEHRVKLIVGDGSGNYSELNFKIKREAYQAKPPCTRYCEILMYDQPASFNNDEANIIFPEGSVYENIRCELKSYANPSSNGFTQWHGLVPANVPLHHKAEIRLTPQKDIPEMYKDKAYIALKRGKQTINVGGEWEGNELVAYSRAMGPYAIMMDTVAPKASLILPRKRNAKLNSLRFKIYDNISASRDLEDLHYEAYIDDQWVLMEYDKKSATISHKFESWLGKGKHSYKLKVKDQLDNERIYSGQFIL